MLQVLFSYKHLFKGREETFKIEDYFSVSEMDLEAGILAPVLYSKVAPLHSYSAISTNIVGTASEKQKFNVKQFEKPILDFEAIKFQRCKNNVYLLT